MTSQPDPRRLPSSYNEDNITDEEITEIEGELLMPNLEVGLKPRDHGERWMLLGYSSQRVKLIEIGFEDQLEPDPRIFHAREATGHFRGLYEAKYGKS
jgi:hypothetical protein